MNRGASGRLAALLGFLAVMLLVIGGLGWVTAEALRLEAEQAQDRAQAEHDLRVKRAMWQLDSRIWPILAREDARPYNHYTALYAPSTAFLLKHRPPGRGAATDLQCAEPGSVLEPSPLLTADLPPWMVLHFQTNMLDWQSPQLISPGLKRLLVGPPGEAIIDPELAQRCSTFDKLQHSTSPKALSQQIDDQAAKETFNDTTVLPDLNSAPANEAKAKDNGYGPAQQIANARPTQDFQSRLGTLNRVSKEVANPAGVDDLSKVLRNMAANGESWLEDRPAPAGAWGRQVTVKGGRMVPIWPASDGGPPRHLIVARMIDIGDQRLCQGVVLDWARLQEVLAEAVREDFPQAGFKPVREVPPPNPDQTMTALPVELVPESVPMPVLPTWTPLRCGLVVAWAASLLGLFAAGMGGWSLLTLSERRIRFVSAVTHELRTPLTTLRLYLDMLAGGLVAPAQQAEYLQALHGETDRLNRLVGNVLDFSRLENQRPRLERATVSCADLLDQVHAAWQARCQTADKALVVEDQMGPTVAITTDVQLVQQVLGNLIDNACKYSQGAADPRIILRAGRGRRGRLVLAVEDHGPGVALTERRCIFRAFRRGRGADGTAGGVGLGLALARRWVQLLGGRLVLEPRPRGAGACFRVEL